MLDEILIDSFLAVPAASQPMFTTEIDFDAIKTTRDNVIAKWRAMTTVERADFKDQKDFEMKNEIPNVKDEKYIPAKNFSLLSNEAELRFNSANTLQSLQLDGIDLHASVLELVESLENTDDIRELYKLRKRSVGQSANAGISAEEATRLKNCFSQGRELYLAGRNGSLMVKPLNFFYALTAYSYGIIVLNNPLRYSKGNLPGSHGMGYLPDNVQAQFGGDSARGTFSDLVTAFPTTLIKNGSFEFNFKNVSSVLEFYKIRHTVSLGTLLSMIPEMSEYYKLTTGKNSRCFPLEIANSNDPRSQKWEFLIGNGEHRPDREGIEKSFPNNIHQERHGKTVITVSAADIGNVEACVYTDIRGNFYYIENPFYPVCLPEICIHFLTTSMFSNIMRYRPDEWGNVLSNEVRSNVSLLTRHYFSSFERKFFIMILRNVSRFFPYVT